MDCQEIRKKYACDAFVRYAPGKTVDPKNVAYYSISAIISASFRGKTVRYDNDGLDYKSPILVTPRIALKALESRKLHAIAKYDKSYDDWLWKIGVGTGDSIWRQLQFFDYEKIPGLKPSDKGKIERQIDSTIKYSNIHCTALTKDGFYIKLF